MTLLYEFENLLIAAFQNSVYVNKYHLANRRLATAGTTFETIAFETIKNLIKEYQKQLDKQLKTSSKSKNNLTFTPYRKIQNVYHNIFNMQDKKHSVVIKPPKINNFAQRYIVNNLIVLDNYINLTKFFNSRDGNEYNWTCMGPSDTSDHGVNVGTNRRLAVGAIINDKHFKTHEILVKEISEFILSYLKENSQLNNMIHEEIVHIILVNESVVNFASKEQNKAKGLYLTLLKKKRQNMFIKNEIDISLILYYTDTPLKILLPIEKYQCIRINVGNKTPFMPYYLVENAELVFTKIKYNQTLEELKKISFQQFIQKYEIMNSHQNKNSNKVAYEIPSHIFRSFVCIESYVTISTYVLNSLGLQCNYIQNAL